MGQWPVLVLPVEAGCHPMVEGERVPGEAAAGAQRRGHPLEYASPVPPCGEVQQSPERAIYQGGLLVEA
jgi:hypothetical protein